MVVVSTELFPSCGLGQLVCYFFVSMPRGNEMDTSSINKKENKNENKTVRCSPCENS